MIIYGSDQIFQTHIPLISTEQLVQNGLYLGLLPPTYVGR